MARTSSTDYDFYTGLVTRVTDVDNNVSTVTEYDALGRPTKVRSAAGTALESWTRTEYDDVNRRVVVRSDIEQIGDGRKVAIQHFDQLGRVRLARSLEDPLTQDPYNETHGLKVETRYKTVSGYSYQLVSNPFRAAASSQASNEPTMGWTLSTAWSKGRRSEVETFSGAALPAAFGGNNTNSTGIVRTDVDANRTLVTDQAGKRRISVSNALGQLKEVWEILAASESGSETVTFPNTSIAHGFKTVYSYDPLNNLTTVTQGVQTRTFTYSSLSRLLTATNPESGTIRYSYDPNGNLLTKTDARGVKTDYVYDALNRVTNRSYSLVGPTPPNYQPTPNVSYFYDNLPNARGKLIKVASSVSTTEYTAFDILGRVTASRQTTDGTAYNMAYSYYVGGALKEETYPSGRVVKNQLDPSGDLLTVTSKKTAGGQFFQYAGSAQYNPAGALTSLQLGNGLYESTEFNARLQPTKIQVGATSGQYDRLKIEYGYGITNNNGNLMSQAITVQPNSAPLFNQTYTYDDLNRLASATETTGYTSTWKQTFIYDRYGNRRFDMANTTVPAAGCTEAICNPTINPNNNRLSSSGYTFDNAGNMTADPVNGGRTFTYDGENKQTAVVSGGSTVGQYFYDGDGRRVKKVVPSTGEMTIFVYDAAGKLVAEYSTVVAPVQDAKVAYLTADHLGSPRINTDANGNIVSRSDYMPYGEEIIAPGGRTANNGYLADDVREGFTSYERDNESDLDYAQMRMYSKLWGRFTSPDRQNAGSDIRIPQSWNGYAYVMNDPLNFTDPNGLIWLRRNGTDSYTWVDDDVYKKNKGDYKDYTPANNAVIRVTGGREAEKNPSLIGQIVVLSEKGPSAVYTISDEDLARGTVFAPAEPLEMSPMHQLIAGSEKTLWFWRPVVYAMTIAVCAPAAVPGLAAGGGSGIGGATLGLGLRAATAAPTGIAALNQLLNQAQRVPTPTQGWTQMTVQGNAQQIFDNIAQGGQRLASGAVQLSDGRIVHLYQSTTPGPLQGPTIQMNVGGAITKIWITP